MERANQWVKIDDGEISLADKFIYTNGSVSQFKIYYSSMLKIKAFENNDLIIYLKVPKMFDSQDLKINKFNFKNRDDLELVYQFIDFKLDK